MVYRLNETHDPGLRSWVESAVGENVDFPIQNLPFGIFRRREASETPRVGVAIGDEVLDLARCRADGLFADLSGQTQDGCAASTLNGLMSLDPAQWTALRRRISEILKLGNAEYSRNPSRLRSLLVPMETAALQMPAVIGDYTDFYASIFHAQNIGSMFRPDNPLLPNYKYVPVAYHGRASTIVLSGEPVFRPSGQILTNPAGPPTIGPTRELDFELEVGFFVGQGNKRGVPIPIEHAEERIFGFCLVNDWSARDIQRWEYQPLGPFLAKSFATTISPWVVTLEAMEPFRVPAFARPAGDPEPLKPLFSRDQLERGGINLDLEARFSTSRMRADGTEPVPLTRVNFKEMYWTPAQMLTHHSSNGCSLMPGDLVASGTVSGPSRVSRGSLLELTWRGEEPIMLPGGETRAFLADGDEVIFRGVCRRPGFVPIGFGECAARVYASPHSFDELQSARP